MRLVAGRAQDLLALSAKYAARPAGEETINDPTVRRHYWRFRSHVRLEDVLADAAFLGGLQALLLGARAAPASPAWRRAIAGLTGAARALCRQLPLRQRTRCGVLGHGAVMQEAACVDRHVPGAKQHCAERFPWTPRRLGARCARRPAGQVRGGGGGRGRGAHGHLGERPRSRGIRSQHR